MARRQPHLRRAGSSAPARRATPRRRCGHRHRQNRRTHRAPLRQPRSSSRTAHQATPNPPGSRQDPVRQPGATAWPARSTSTSRSSCGGRRDPRCIRRTGPPRCQPGERLACNVVRGAPAHRAGWRGSRRKAQGAPRRRRPGPEVVEECVTRALGATLDAAATPAQDARTGRGKSAAAPRLRPRVGGPLRLLRPGAGRRREPPEIVGDIENGFRARSADAAKQVEMAGRRGHRHQAARLDRRRLAGHQRPRPRWRHSTTDASPSRSGILARKPSSCSAFSVLPMRLVTKLCACGR